MKVGSVVHQHVRTALPAVLSRPTRRARSAASSKWPEREQPADGPSVSQARGLSWTEVKLRLSSLASPLSVGQK